MTGWASGFHPSQLLQKNGWLVLRPGLNGKWFCHFGKRKRKREKQTPVQWEVKREEEKKNPIVWEVKRENKYYSHFLRSEQRQIKWFPVVGEVKREKKYAISW